MSLERKAKKKRGKSVDNDSYIIRGGNVVCTDQILEDHDVVILEDAFARSSQQDRGILMSSRMLQWERSR